MKYQYIRKIYKYKYYTVCFVCVTSLEYRGLIYQCFCFLYDGGNEEIVKSLKKKVKKKAAKVGLTANSNFYFFKSFVIYFSYIFQ